MGKFLTQKYKRILKYFTDQKPVLEICDFKNLINSNSSLREEKIKNMKSKLDVLIEEGNWDCEDLFLEHDYSKSSVFECVVYYLGG